MIQAPKIMGLLSAQARYGEIRNGAWGGETTWCTVWQIPNDLKPALQTWINTATGLAVGRIYCNRDIQGPLERALRKVMERGLADQLVSFDGCFMIRDVRGLPGHVSAHAYACAIDLNAKTNALGTPGDMSDELAACFIEEGFTWGKRFRRQDPMHLSYLGF